MKHPYRPTKVTHTVQYIIRTYSEEGLRSYGQSTITMSPKAEQITKEGKSCP